MWLHSYTTFPQYFSLFPFFLLHISLLISFLTSWSSFVLTFHHTMLPWTEVKQLTTYITKKKRLYTLIFKLVFLLLSLSIITFFSHKRTIYLHSSTLTIIKFSQLFTHTFLFSQHSCNLYISLNRKQKYLPIIYIANISFTYSFMLNFYLILTQ